MEKGQMLMSELLCPNYFVRIGGNEMERDELRSLRKGGLHS